MDHTYWHKQDVSSPLFPDMLWSRPENKMHAGKLLILGGNAHAFSAPASAYMTALRAGAGACRVVLPDALKKTIGKQTSDFTLFAPSNPSGSFAQTSLDEILLQGDWADAVLMAGDFGRNSETAIVLEKFTNHYKKPVIITRDSADYFIAHPDNIIQNNFCLVLRFSQLQKLAVSLKFEHAFTSNMEHVKFVETLHEFSSRYHNHVIVRNQQHTYIASGGMICTTPHDSSSDNTWQVDIAAHASVWWMQNPSKPYAAFCSSILPQKSLDIN
jgi:ADP-dependent NAD(P)H-hydrate dehydratase / NAD(P)H-hydrate epimerase